jgi:hypothetical protein
MDLSNYVDVATRLKMGLEKWPDLRIQETGRELLEAGDKVYLVCTVTVWRTADDTHPSIASAWEPIPGLTPYTKNSELMVGYTSALGRALGYMGIGVTGSLASANEVANRPKERPSEAPRRAPVGSAAPQGGEGPSKAQLGLLSSLKYTGPTPANKFEASRLIDTLKKAQQDLDAAKASDEEAF